MYDSFLDAIKHCRKLNCMKFIKPSNALNEHIQTNYCVLFCCFLFFFFLCACKIAAMNVCVQTDQIQSMPTPSSSLLLLSFFVILMNLFCRTFDCYRFWMNANNLIFFVFEIVRSLFSSSSPLIYLSLWIASVRNDIETKVFTYAPMMNRIVMQFVCQ